jgi:hypothetical protein
MKVGKRPHGANIRMIQQVLSNKLEINISTFANVQNLLYLAIE